MAATSTLTIRTDSVLKQQASELFESLSMNMSMVINIFLRQAVIHKKYPCSIDSTVVENPEKTYPAGFFELFGTDVDTGMQEPNDIIIEAEDIELWCII